MALPAKYHLIRPDDQSLQGFQAELEKTARISNLEAEVVESSADGTKKYLFRLSDGNAVESVLIPDEDRNTLCISSQVGCAMGCEFCLTGTFRLTRNLTTAEIVNQVCAVKREEPVRNIVSWGWANPWPILKMSSVPCAF